MPYKDKALLIHWAEALLCDFIEVIFYLLKKNSCKLNAYL